MKLQITECEGFGIEILKNLADYKTVDGYLHAVMQDLRGNGPVFDWCPKNCTIKNSATNRTTDIIKHGKITDDAEYTMQELRLIPEHKRRIMSDSLVIEIDMFESDMVISWE